MTAFTSRGFIAGALSLAVLFAVPVVPRAATSTFPITIDRNGVPGTELEPVFDPATGQPVVDENGNPVFQKVQTGAFVNPCVNAGEWVNVLGAGTLSIGTSLPGNGQLKVTVGISLKGTGTGIIPYDPLTGVAVPSGNTYSFADNQSFKATFVVASDPTTIIESSFTDRFTMKGSKSTNNWTIRAKITIKLDASGNVLSTSQTFTGDVCNG
jgi:hypothetical protein